MDREALGSWLQGPRAASGVDLGRPGERLGLPAEGPGSVAGFGSRVVAFLYDSLMCNGVALLLLRDVPRNISVFLVFAVEVLLFTWTLGGSAGQRLHGLGLVRLDGLPVGLPRAALRTLLLVLLVPALIWDRDGRGLHDRAAGTVLVHVARGAGPS